MPDFIAIATFGCFDEASSPEQKVFAQDEVFSTLILFVGYDILTLAKGTCVCILKMKLYSINNLRFFFVKY